jgi:hypothetical protein
MNQTLGIIPFSLRGDILSKIKEKQDLRVILERKFDLSIEQALSLLNKNIKEQ